MAADATLVQAARLEALSKVPRIDKDLAKRQAGITTTIIEGAQAIVTAKNLENKIKNEADKLLREGQIAEFQTLADDVNKRLATYDKGGREAGMHEQIYNNTYDHIATLKAEYEKYNTIGDDDTAENRKKRVEIMAQMEQIKNSTIDLRGTVQAIGAGFGTDAIDPTGFNKTITDLDLKIGGEIMNMDGDYSNVTQRWDADTNQIFFDVVVDGETHTWSATDLKNKFPTIEGANKLSSSLIENSTTTLDGIKKAKLGDKFNLQGNVDDIVEVLGTYQKSDASHVFQTKQHGVDASGWVIPEGSSGKWEKGSWANALEANSDLNGSYSLSSDAKAEVVGDLIAKGLLDVEDVDTDGVDGISAEELEAVMTTENRDLVISALVDSNNPLYDHELSKREYAVWRANQNKSLHDDDQKKKQAEEDKKERDRIARLPKGDKKTETGWVGSDARLNTHGGNRTVDYDIAKDMYDSFVEARDGKATNFNLYNVKYDYDPATDNWYTGEGDDKIDYGNSDQFRKSLGISEPDFKAVTSQTKEVVKIKPIKPVEKVEGTYSTISGLEDLINFDTLAKGDDKVVENLNNAMPTAYTTENPEGYYWDEGTDQFFMGWAGDDPFTQSIQLFDGNGNPVKWPDNYRDKNLAGKNIYIRTKGEHRKKAIEYIDDVLTIFGLAENMGGGALLD